MVRALVCLILWTSLLIGYDVPWTIEQGLRHLKKEDDPEKQIQALDESKIIFDPVVLKSLTDKLDEKERKAFIQTLMKKYPHEERKLLINALLISSDYQTLLSNLPENECSTVSENAFPTYMGGLPLIDWMNMIRFPDTHVPPLKSAILYRKHFNDFNTFNAWDLFLEPYGFMGSVDLEKDSLAFDLYTLGGALGGGFSFAELWGLSAALGYSHSDIHWKNTSDRASAHTLTFEPNLNFQNSRFFVSTKILGAVNFYTTDRKTLLFPEQTIDEKRADSSLNSWDLLSQLSGGLSLPVGGHFYFYPQASFDYGVTFIRDSSERLDKNTHLHINSLRESFFRWVIEGKLTRETFKEGFGMIIPYLLAGWCQNIPLSAEKIHYQLEGCTNPIEREVTIGNWGQYNFGVGLSLLHVRGIVLSFDYSLRAGEETTFHTGSLLIALTW